jgi:hypothetical protein
MREGESADTSPEYDRVESLSQGDFGYGAEGEGLSTVTLGRVVLV